MVRMEVKDSPCREPGIALDFNVSNDGLKRASDKSSLDMADMNEPKLPFLGVCEDVKMHGFANAPARVTNGGDSG